MKPISISIAVFCLIGVAWITPSALQFVSLNRLIPNGTPQRQRTMMFPEKKEILDITYASNKVDLVTFSFSMPADMSFEVFGGKDKVSPLEIWNDSVSITVKPPVFDPEGIAHEYEIESAVFPKFWDIVAMSKDDFTRCYVRLSFKSSMRFGVNKTYSFKSRTSTGIMWIGEDDPSDATTAAVTLTDVARDIQMFFIVRQKQNDFDSMTNMLDHIAGTIKFDINAMKEWEPLQMEIED